MRLIRTIKNLKLIKQMFSHKNVGTYDFSSISWLTDCVFHTGNTFFTGAVESHFTLADGSLRLAFWDLSLKVFI